jgi:hypothetical protein
MNIFRSYAEKPFGKLTAAILLLGAVAVTACGDDEDEEKSKSGAAISACENLCPKQIAGGCALGVDEATCKQFCQLLTVASADCQAKYKVWADCQTTQNAVCDDTKCQTEEKAYEDCT